MLNIDLHCHSTISDGLLTPAQLVERAALRGVETLALTDHDDIAGLTEARQTADAKNITFINGVEISVSWRGRTLHIVGLDIDPEYTPLIEGLTAIRAGRSQRAANIAAELEKVGIHGSLDGGGFEVVRHGDSILLQYVGVVRDIKKQSCSRLIHKRYRPIWLEIGGIRCRHRRLRRRPIPLHLQRSFLAQAQVGSHCGSGTALWRRRFRRATAVAPTA